MTIRRRLLISHLVMFITPITMLLLMMIIMTGGLFLFIHSGNHVYLESSDQFTRAADIMYNVVFHSKRSETDMENMASYDKYIRVIAPVQNYVLLCRDDVPIYRYGNESLAAFLSDLPPRETLHEVSDADRGAYMLIQDNTYVSVRKRKVGQTPFYLYFVSYQAPHGTDDRLEHVSRFLFRFIGVALLVFLGLTSWFLSGFMIRRIISPLHLLEEGAKQVEQGDLTVRLQHKGNDEFTSVFQAFNTMTQAVADLVFQHEEDEKKRKELIASISHDIRTPLTVIKAYAEGLADGVANSEEKRARYVEVIRQKTEILDEMVDQLFLLSKMDIGNKAFPLEEVDLKDFVEQFVKKMEEELLSQGMTVNVHGVSSCRITASGLLLRRILFNLISNSVKYMDKDTGHIDISMKDSGEAVVLEVADDGPGVPEEDLPHLFEAFFRSDKARTRTGNGSGLGLAIVARAMELMKGSAKARKGPGGGLVISLVWPRPYEGKSVPGVQKGNEKG